MCMYVVINEIAMKIVMKIAMIVHACKMEGGEEDSVGTSRVSTSSVILSWVAHILPGLAAKAGVVDGDQSWFSGLPMGIPSSSTTSGGTLT